MNSSGNSSDNSRNHSDIPSETGLVALLELRELLAGELDRGEGTDPVQRTFQPITDGLGLESPKRREGRSAPKPLPPPPPKPEKLMKSATQPVKLIVDDALLPEPPAFPEQFRTREHRRETPESREQTPPTDRASTTRSVNNTFFNSFDVEPEPAHKVPPQLPRPSFFRRLFSLIIDEVFVLTVCFLALVLTLNLLRGMAAHTPGDTYRQIQNPLFIRFAILEFATIWISYFAICIGVLDMTFGMWVWGLRVTYGKDATDSILIKKLMRIVLSFFFYAPVAPLLLLAPQRKGRNLLDWMTGTGLYRSVL